ncbi:hypothetical protein ES705_38953 [subsurface metagenome]
MLTEESELKECKRKCLMMHEKIQQWGDVLGAEMGPYISLSVEARVAQVSREIKELLLKLQK